MEWKCPASPHVRNFVPMAWLSSVSKRIILICYKVRKEAKIKNQYNQVSHLTKDTTWESGKNTRNHHVQESQDVSCFPARVHKAILNRQDSMTDMNTKYKKDPQKKHYLGTVSKNYFIEGLKLVPW